MVEYDRHYLRQLQGPAYARGVQAPLARILAHEAEYWTTVSEVEQRQGWLLFRNRYGKPRLSSSLAGGFRGAEGSARDIVGEVVEFYRHRGSPPVAYVDMLATPVDLVPYLFAAGFRETPQLTGDLMLYLGPDGGQPSKVDVTRVETPHDEAAWAGMMDEIDDPETRQALYKLYRMEISDVRVSAYLAWIDGQPAGRCMLFSSLGLGRIEAVRTAAPFRGRGVGSALVRQAVHDSLTCNHFTYIYASPGSRGQRLYRELGFRTVGEKAMRTFVMVN